MDIRCSSQPHTVSTSDIPDLHSVLTWCEAFLVPAVQKDEELETIYAREELTELLEKALIQTGPSTRRDCCWSILVYNYLLCKLERRFAPPVPFSVLLKGQRLDTQSLAQYCIGAPGPAILDDPDYCDGPLLNKASLHVLGGQAKENLYRRHCFNTLATNSYISMLDTYWDKLMRIAGNYCAKNNHEEISVYTEYQLYANDLDPWHVFATEIDLRVNKASSTFRTENTNAIGRAACDGIATILSTGDASNIHFCIVLIYVILASLRQYGGLGDQYAMEIYGLFDMPSAGNVYYNAITKTFSFVMENDRHVLLDLKSPKHWFLQWILSMDNVITKAIVEPQALSVKDPFNTLLLLQNL